MNSKLKSYLRNVSNDIDIVGDLDFKNLGFDLREPKPKTLTFCNSVDFLKQSFSKENVSAIITSQEIFSALSLREIKEKSFVIADDPKNYFFKLHNYLYSIDFYHRDPFVSHIENTAVISKLASIAPKNVIIGKNTIIEDFVVIKENVKIGDNTRIQSGAVIGNDCLQCIIEKDNLVEVEHVGGVNIGSHVKIESNSIVCKHIFNDDTKIDDHAKIGGLVHISHGCKIGQRSILTANILLGGSTHIGCDVFIGPNVTTSPMISIGNKARLSIGSVVTKNVLSEEHVTGNFAIPHKKFIDNLKNSV